MKKTIQLSPDLKLPTSVVTQKLALLGISGSGKTYASGKLVEGLFEVGAQVVIVDTVGNWYGLRLAAGGKKPGIAIPILGGDHGDVALDENAGKNVAALIAESRAPMIVDVSDFTKGELQRFVADFATALLVYKKKSPSPVMIVWEECQDVVPQFVKGDVARTVGAVQKLVKRGRNYGVGTVLISQRPAAVNKDVLSQIETLFAFRMNGKHDRRQIEDWIVDKDIDVGEMVDELPSLATGNCFVWSPQWLKVLTTIKIGKKWTFDATATPEFGEEVKAGKLAPVDLRAFEKTMAESIEKAKTADPEVAKKRIAQLESELRLERLGNQQKAQVIAKRLEARPFIKDAQISKLERLLGAADVMMKRAESRIIELATQAKDLAACLGEARTRELVDMAKMNVVSPFELRIETGRVSSRRVAAKTNGKSDRPDGTGSGSPPVARRTPLNERALLGGPERRILDAVAWFESIGIYSPENAAVAFLARYRRRPGRRQSAGCAAHHRRATP